MQTRTNILLVDDRPDSLLALEAVLSCPQYNLITARSGAEALSRMQNNSFAVVLLDVQMPEMDGFETATRIRNLSEHVHTPIIFVTAINKDEAYVQSGYQAGAVDYIFKPFDETILRAKVSVFVELYKQAQKIENQARQIKDSFKHERYLRLAQLEVEVLKRYQSLADSIPHSIWRSKADGTMDYFNRVWMEYTGLTEYQSMGVGWESAFHPEDLRKFLKTWMEKITLGQEFRIECRIRNSKGEMRWNLIHAISEKGARGEILAWFGTCTDIQKIKEIEVKLIEAQKQADASNDAKTNFLANMSHEIRTPLNSILGFAELMMCPEQTDEDKIKNLATIRKNGYTLVKIIDEILDISKVETGHLVMESVETDVCRLLSELRALLVVQADEKKLQLNFFCENSIPTKIITDPTRFQQILVNVVGNSLKFTEKGKVELSVSWFPDKNAPGKGRLHCRVSDTGIGIDPAEAKNLFKPFAQIDSSKTRKFGGTGLGLALARRLAKALGGDVYIEHSNKGTGSVFGIDIFTSVVAEEPLVGCFNSLHEQLDLNPYNYKNFLKNVRILVVDDSPDNRNLITQFLRAAGAEVDCAVDGHEGVEKAYANDYQIVLMDIQMPNLDGYEATVQLRQKGYTKPIIALTAHALKEERLSSLAVGCNDHLTKPIDRKTLIEQMARHIGKDISELFLSESKFPAHYQKGAKHHETKLISAF